MDAGEFAILPNNTNNVNNKNSTLPRNWSVGAGKSSTPTPTPTAPPLSPASSPKPGSTIRILEDPLFDIDVIMGSSAVSGAEAAYAAAAANMAANTSASSAASIPSKATTTNSNTSAVRSTAADVLEKARDRFDRFWGGNIKEESV